MNIGKISGINYRSLGVSEKIPFKNKNASSPRAQSEEDSVELLSIMKSENKKLRDSAPEAGVVLTSLLVGGIILYKLFLGKKY